MQWGERWTAEDGPPLRLMHEPCELIAARLVMGYGAAVIIPTSLSIISNTFGDRHAPGGAIALAAVAGVLLSVRVGNKAVVATGLGLMGILRLRQQRTP
jgi:thiamine transporter ThiT